MLLGAAPLPFVAVTLVTPVVIVMVPQLVDSVLEFPLPPPIPAASSPPVAVTVPPLMRILPQEEASLKPLLPPPIPAACSPPVAVTVPPEMVMLPQVALKSPPMPAAYFPPVAVIVPPWISILPQATPNPPPMPAPLPLLLAVREPMLLIMSVLPGCCWQDAHYQENLCS